MSSTNQPSTPGSSSNPAFSANAFTRAMSAMPQSAPMTIAGAINKTLLLVAITAAVAYVTAGAWIAGAPWAMPAMYVGLFGGLIVGLVTAFKPNVAHITAPIYAVLEGAFIGVLSAIFNAQFDGIVLQAVGGTFAVFLVMLVLYRTRVIKVTARFRMVVIGATAGILVFYLVTIVLGLFGVNTSAVIGGGGTLAIGISVVICIVAALNLALDFDFIEAGANAQAPERMEWYASWGLLVTLVWLYLEILRLLAATRR